MEENTTLFNLTHATEFTHDDLVNIFATAELYTSEYFEVWVPKKFKDLKTKGPGNCYEDSLVNVLANGGYICVADVEDSGDANEIVTLEEARKFKNSKVLDVESVVPIDAGGWSDTYYCPVYKIDMKRITSAIQEIVSGNTTCETAEEKACIRRAYNNMFIADDYDFYDGWNLFQYIVFGDIIYC